MTAPPKNLVSESLSSSSVCCTNFPGKRKRPLQRTIIDGDIVSGMRYSIENEAGLPIVMGSSSSVDLIEGCGVVTTTDNRNRRLSRICVDNPRQSHSFVRMQCLLVALFVTSWQMGVSASFANASPCFVGNKRGDSSCRLAFRTSINRSLQIHHPLRQHKFRSSQLVLSSTPAKDSRQQTYDFDSLEEEMIREQSLHPNNKSYTSRTKQQRRRGTSTLPTEPAGKVFSSRRSKRRRRGSKTAKVASASAKSVQSSMPPWLSQFEYDNFDNPSLHALSSLEESESPIIYSRKESKQHQNPESSSQLNNSLAHKMQRLQLAMSGSFHPSYTTSDSSIPNAISFFSPTDIHDVLDAIRVSSQSNANLMAGCADFLYLMLSLEEEGVLSNGPGRSNADFEVWEDEEDFEFNHDYKQKKPDPHSIMTRDVLVAAAFHYCDCVRARKAGVYDYVRQAMEANLDSQRWKMEEEQRQQRQFWLPSASDEKERGDHATSTENTAIFVKKVTHRGKNSIESYGEESTKIAAGAARLKRAEIMATTTKHYDSSQSTSVTKRSINTSSGDDAILRSFLVSLSDDWRALVIRSSACLYRLKGIVDDDSDNEGGGKSAGKYNGSMVLSSTTIQTARDALRVYAPLAQRLGMQRLKSELENTAFRILYRRQYSVASSLYNGDIEEMKAIVNVLTTRIEQLLKSDAVFTEQVDDVTVSSRVKEPYSLWKKIIRYRKEVARTSNDKSTFVPTTLSMKWVPDAIALRVILRGRRLPLEDEESLRTREKMLCYFAFQLISDVWPASTANKAKDYIKNPKSNGYQSLHYTAALVINEEEWPFEVQIRSEEMHRIAEFGVAAHWDYKLQKKSKALPDKSMSKATNLPLALPASAVETKRLSLAQSIKVSIDEEEFDISQPNFNTKGRISSYIEALTTSREKLVQNNLFVFVSSSRSALDGRIVSVDPSACNVADVLEQYGVEMSESIIEDISRGTIKLYRNGVLTMLDRELANGDVLTLPAFLIDAIVFD